MHVQFFVISYHAQAEEQTLHPSAPEMANLPSSGVPAEPPKKRKGPKGPNPLSVKKKKSKDEVDTHNKKQESERSDAGSKRKLTEQYDGVDAQPPGGRKRKRRRKTADHGIGDAAERVS